MQYRPTSREAARQQFAEKPASKIPSYPSMEADEKPHTTTERGIWSSGGDVFDSNGDVDMNDWGARQASQDTKAEIMPPRCTPGLSPGTTIDTATNELGDVTQRSGSPDRSRGTGIDTATNNLGDIDITQRSVWSEGADVFDSNGDVHMNDWVTTRSTTVKTMPEVVPYAISSDVDDSSSSDCKPCTVIDGVEECTLQHCPDDVVRIGNDVQFEVTMPINATTTSTTNTSYVFPSPIFRPDQPFTVSRLQTDAPDNGNMMIAGSTPDNSKDLYFGIGIGLGVLGVLFGMVIVDFYRKRWGKPIRDDPEGDYAVARHDAELAAMSKSEHAGHSVTGASSDVASVRSMQMSSGSVDRPCVEYPGRDNVILNVVLRKEAEAENDK